MTEATCQHWIIDCDPGCDDAVALALAAQQLGNATVEVLTVAGNVGVDLTTWNACRVLAACKKKWPVYRGCSSSLSGEAVPASSVHGRDGLGDLPNNGFDIKPSDPQPTNAVMRYSEVAQREKDFVLVCTGPLTNLATALNLMSLEDQKAFWKKCQICVIMGGAFEAYGNITSSAEFNTHFDPVATHLVLESWRQCEGDKDDENGTCTPKLHFVPLDITEEVAIPLDNKAHDLKSDTAKSTDSKFLLAALRKYGLFHSRNCKRPGDRESFGIKGFEEEDYLKDRVKGENGQRHLGAFCFLHDPLAMWVAIQWSNKAKDFNKWWSDANVTMDIGHGAGRGQLIQHSVEKFDSIPSRATPLGTRVMWLDPDKFEQPGRNEFVDCIKKLLGLPMS